jgi:hypothetical protein
VSGKLFAVGCVVLLSLAAMAQIDPVLWRAEIARQHMRQLSLGYQIYRNDYGAPPHLVDLYPHYVSNPRSFWHPGDRNRAPTTIDNEVPNGRNSARISFDWPLAVSDYTLDLPLIQDNTAANNDGRLVNFMTVDGVIETEPALATPTPTRDELARAHIRRFAQAFRLYSNDNEEYYPLDLKALWDTRCLGSPRTAWNPGDSDPCPTEITNSVPNTPRSIAEHLRRSYGQDLIIITYEPAPDLGLFP